MGWQFAVGISSVTDFSEQQDAKTLADFAVFKAEYRVTGGPDDGLIFPLTMRLCDEEKDWPNFYEFNAEQKETILQHKRTTQFWCPKTFDLSIYNTFDNLESKVVNIYLTNCDQQANP